MLKEIEELRVLVESLKNPWLVGVNLRTAHHKVDKKIDQISRLIKK